MKKIFLLVIISLFSFCICNAQQTFWTPGVPPGSTSFNWSVRFSGTDSLANLYFSNGNKWWQAYTAAQSNLRFLLKSDSTENSGYVTHGYFNANIPSTFNNGLTNTSGVVQLGGNLTQPTLINSNGQFLSIGSFNGPILIVAPDDINGVSLLDIAKGYSVGLHAQGGALALVRTSQTNKISGFSIDSAGIHLGDDSLGHGILYTKINLNTLIDSSLVPKIYVDSLRRADTGRFINLSDASQLFDFNKTLLMSSGASLNIANRFTPTSYYVKINGSNGDLIIANGNGMQDLKPGSWSYSGFDSNYFSIDADPNSGRGYNIITSAKMTSVQMRTHFEDSLKSVLTPTDPQQVLRLQDIGSLPTGSGFALKDSSLQINNDLYDIPNKTTARFNLGTNLQNVTSLGNSTTNGISFKEPTDLTANIFRAGTYSVAGTYTPHTLIVNNTANTATKIQIEPNGHIDDGTTSKLDFMLTSFDNDPTNYQDLAIFGKVGNATGLNGESGAYVFSPKSVGNFNPVQSSIHFSFNDDASAATLWKAYYYNFAGTQWYTPMRGGWYTGKSITTGDYITASGNIYQATSTGIAGSTVPSFSSGSGSDGTVSYNWIVATGTLRPLTLFSNGSTMPLFNLTTTTGVAFKYDAFLFNGTKFRFGNSTNAEAVEMGTDAGGSNFYMRNLLGTNSSLRISAAATSPFIQVNNLGWLLPDITLTGNSTTPSIAGGASFTITNSLATSVTSFSSGTAMQDFYVKGGNGNTTLVQSATLQLANQTNKVLSTNTYLHFRANSAGTSFVQITDGLMSGTDYVSPTGSLSGNTGLTTTGIVNNAVTLAKLATQANNTILGNNSGSTAAPSALTATQVSTLIATATPQLITGTPTIIAGAGAGTAPTVSVTTNGKQLQVTVTTGTLPTGTNATIATVTLANTLSYTPYPVFSSPPGAASLLSAASMIGMASTGPTNVTITSGTTALTAATTYVWNVTL